MTVLGKAAEYNYPSRMSAEVHDSSQQVIQAFPPWLDLPPGYIVNDWIAWQKGKLVARRLREHPELVQVAVNRLESRRDRLFGADLEWMDLLHSQDLEAIARLLESDDDEGQRLRSSTPFSREPFISAREAEDICERAYLG